MATIIPLQLSPFVSVCLGSRSLELTVYGHDSLGWSLHAIDPESWYILHTAKNEVRRWASLDTLFKFLDSQLKMNGATVPVVITYDPRNIS